MVMQILFGQGDILHSDGTAPALELQVSIDPEPTHAMRASQKRDAKKEPKSNSQGLIHGKRTIGHWSF
jgi:hypothetical protein